MSDNIEDKDKSVKLYGKVAKFPKNLKSSAKNAYSFLENIAMPKKKLWYIIIEKETVINDDVIDELQLIKFNNKEGLYCKKIVDALKTHYSKNPEFIIHLEKLKIDGNDKFSTIRNIPNIEIDGKMFINIISEDLIKLLYK